MVDEKFIRTAMLIGEEGIEKLKKSSVTVFGVGGVGSFTAEALARSGVGKITVVDYDTISESNINRQSHAFTDTVGEIKVEEMKRRIERINPDIDVRAVNIMMNKDNIDEIMSEGADYAVDAIDMVSSKIALIEYCCSRDIPVISAMGAGNKLNPAMLEVSDIHSTSVCPLARVMRREMRNRNIEKLKVVYSKEKPVEPINPEMLKGEKFSEESSEGADGKSGGNKRVPGSTAFVPSVSGLIIASEVVKDLIGYEDL